MQAAYPSYTFGEGAGRTDVDTLQQFVELPKVAGDFWKLWCVAQMGKFRGGSSVSCLPDVEPRTWLALCTAGCCFF